MDLPPLESSRRLVVVGAVVLTAMGLAASAQTVIVDNSDPEFTILSGSWSSGVYATPYGADYNWVETTNYSPPEPFSEAEWRPVLPDDGMYEVSVWYVEGTNRADDATFTIHDVDGATPVTVDQQVNGSTWFSLGTFPFGAGSTGYVTLDNDASPNVVIADAVRFTRVDATVELTMVAYPASRGTVIPTPATYTKAAGEIVSIGATPEQGYEFDRWVVTAGGPPADPYAENTTVVADENKTVAALFVTAGSGDTEWRAFWIDAFHEGFKSTAQIDAMIGRALTGNYNVLIPEVLAFHDTGATGHGAYWNSNLVPKAGDISGGIDPLAYMVQQAHANGLEVHPWLVAFRVSSSWPPSGNAIVSAHPEWLMSSRSQTDSGPVRIGTDPGYYTFDPGSPDVQQYLLDIVHELCTNYAIDGIHWDYIRYTQTDAGYPTDGEYAGSSLARFHEITGRSDLPSTTDSQWSDFRRRTITEVVRRAMAEVATADSLRQPLRHTAALVTWSPANSNFHLTNAYALFCDWEYWQSMGYLDATIPMCYFEEQSYASTYRAWVDNSVGWAAQHGRHTYIGPGIYMNLMADSRDQIEYARNAGADGITTYSYRVTNDDPVPWTDWYIYVSTELFTAPAAVPSMPWRNPMTTTEGAVYGRVADGATGQPIDNALIYVDEQSTGIRTDGNGCFLVSRQYSGPAGLTRRLKASATGYSSIERMEVRIEPAGFTEANLAVGSWKFGDYDVDGEVSLEDYGHLAECITGPGNGPPAAGCDAFDGDADNDVDLADVRLFQSGFGS